MKRQSVATYNSERDGIAQQKKSHVKHPCHGQSVSPVNLKRCVTLVALISADSALQQYLPQVVLVNTAGETRKWNLPSTAALESQTFQIWKDDTQWMTSATMQKYLHALRAALDRAGRGRAVLVMDACRAHMAEDIWDTFRACNIRPIIIPAGMTKWLQPLDVYVFGTLKRQLSRHGSMMLRERDDGVELPFEQWLAGLHKTVHDTLTLRTWERTFTRVGCNNAATDLHNAILQWYKPNEQMPLTRPSVADMSCLYGKTSLECYHALFPEEYFARACGRPHHWRRPHHRLSSKRSIDAI